MTPDPARRRLGRRPGFRRLLALRALSQAADGTVQVGMAAYLLFSPTEQPDAWSIAAILALTFLPFTLLGPFVSPLLDVWSRRQVLVVSDLVRAGLSLLVGVLILTGATAGGWRLVLFATLLVLLSVNRFMLAGLTAGLQHVVDEDEYLAASSILPMVGPLGVVFGALLGLGARLGLAPWLGLEVANAVVFWAAALLFLGSVALGLGFRRDALGPSPGAARVRVAQVGRELAVALQHLAGRPVAALAIAMLFGVRLMFGLFFVAVILAFRNLLSDDPATALADLTLWGTLTGVGFIAASAVVPMLGRWFGLRWAAVAVLVAVGLAAGVGLGGGRVALLGASVAVGLGTQCYKIAADTFVQAHVAEEFKGRVFTFQDMTFNAAFVLAAVVAAVLLPQTGIGVGVAPGLAAAWLLLAVAFWWASSRIGAEEFEKGTKDLGPR
ncbi:MAG: MFS transporter [Propionibacteriaceae bacterium]|nr:MFS transporter [Propionibacteriaceae bacterium]